MKTSIKIILIVLGIALMLMTGCKKYEEDAGVPLQSKKALWCRDWEMEKELKNGIVISNYMDSINVYGHNTFKFYGDGMLLVCLNNFNFQGTWKFLNNKNRLQMFGEGGGDIIRLNKRELWIRSIEGAVVYESHFASKR